MKKSQTKTEGAAGFSKDLVKAFREARGEAEKSPTTVVTSDKSDGKWVWVKIADIRKGTRIRQHFDCVDDRAEDIKVNGLKYPIILNTNLVLVDGECRLRACQQLGWDEIKAIIEDIPEDEILSYEIALNVQRESFSVFEARVATDKLMEGQRASAGRPSKKKLLTDCKEFSGDTEARLEEAAKKAGFRGAWEYYRVKKIEKSLFPELHDAIIKKEVTAHQALCIVQAKRSVQSSLLKRIIENEKSGPKSHDERAIERQKKGEGKAAKLAPEYAIPRKPEEKYNVIRIAPDFMNDSLQEICRRYPVGGFVSPDAVICLECSTRHLDLAFEALSTWKLHYKAIITLGWKVYSGAEMNYIEEDAWHIVFGQVDKTMSMDCPNGTRMVALNVFDDPTVMARHIITEYFGTYTDGKGCMLDMSATEPHDGWDILELKFRKNKK